jgi:murein DD-endopeptidase MepM/ murein hydrolase activator NlpD
MLIKQPWPVTFILVTIGVILMPVWAGYLMTTMVKADWAPLRLEPVRWPEPQPGVGALDGSAAVAALPVSKPLVGWPVAGRISQGFGCSPYYTGRPGPGCPAEAPWFHDGVDIAAPAGAPVRAAITGAVIFAGADGSGPACGRYRGYGLGVVIATEAGWQTLYAHLAQIDVVVGQMVRPETIIGAVGETGCVSGAHLHFGLRDGATLVDPRSHVGYEGSGRQHLD